MVLRLEIEKIYIAYFNRPADGGGLAYWEGEIASGRASLADITSAFSTVPEYTALYAGKSSVDVVTAIYKNLFGRDPEPEGLKFWSEGLDSGQFGIGTMAYDTLGAAQGSDRTTVVNKATAALEFTRSLEAEGSDKSYTGDAVEAARAWLARIDETPDSVAAATNEIGEIIGGEISGPDPEPEPEPLGPARTFTFTVGWDLSKPVEMPADPFAPMEVNFPPHVIRDFVLGHDKIKIVDLDDAVVSVPSPTWNYVHAEHTGGAGLNYQFSIFGAMGHAHNGGKAHSLDGLMPGESVLITYDNAAGQSRTLLFIDDGEAGKGQGMDNGVGLAVLNAYSDVIIDVTGLIGLKTTSNELHVVGSFFV